MTTAGYKALREGAAVLDIAGRGKIRALGADRVRLLHAMTTNHVEQLKPGQGCYTFFLNAQGRILADANILAMPDHLLLDTEAATRERLYQHLDKYIIADDVTLEDATESAATVGLEGPGALAIMEQIGSPMPDAPYATRIWGSRTVARLNAAGGEGFWFFLPREKCDALVSELIAAGAVEASHGDLLAVRLEQGKPRYGDDFSDAHLPQETQLMHAVHFNKGCYLGQEIVERIRSRGNVHRLLVRVGIEGAVVPARGTKLASGDKEAGEIMSAAFSPARGCVVAFAYVRGEFLRSRVALMAGEAPAKLIQ